MGQIPQKLFVLPALVRGRSVIYVNVGILDGVVDIRENGRRRRKVNKRATTLAAGCVYAMATSKPKVKYVSE